jgi:hypothetical protein
MSTAKDGKVWQAWLLKGKLREEATAPKAKLFGGILLACLVVGTVIYRFAVV